MFEEIPSCLKEMNQWVCVRSDSKIPLNAYTGEAASSVNPSTWCDFDTAASLVEQGLISNIGFVFNDTDIIGVDIDDGYDEDGFLSALACDIVRVCGSYTEKSRSGKGFHILLRGNLPFKGKNNLAGVEIYKSARYFIMTGSVLLYREIIENQEAIDYVIQKYFPEVKEKKQTDTIGSRIYSPIWEMPENNRIKLRPVYPRVPDGSRNICLTSLAGMLHNIGYSKTDIYNEIMYANLTACDPPLDKYELQTITRSVTRYKR